MFGLPKGEVFSMRKSFTLALLFIAFGSLLSHSQYSNRLGNWVLIGGDYDNGDSYDKTNRTPLVRLFYSDDSPYGLRSGIHISCNFTGYYVVSTFIDPDEPEQNWLDRTIIIVRLDPQNPQTYYLAKLYNKAGSYWKETQAAITNDGSKIVWVSNWGQNVGNEQDFLMQLDMPLNWADRDIYTTLRRQRRRET